VADGGRFTALIAGKKRLKDLFEVLMQTDNEGDASETEKRFGMPEESEQFSAVIGAWRETRKKRPLRA
jgi:hypothetical protein